MSKKSKKINYSTAQNKAGYGSALVIELNKDNDLIVNRIETKINELEKETKEELSSITEKIVSAIQEHGSDSEIIEDILREYVNSTYSSIEETILSELHHEFRCQEQEIDSKLGSLEHAKELTNKLEYLLPELDNYYSSKGEYFVYRELQDLTDSCISTVDEIL